jgi:WD40 repeat protein/tetratricopeptide (TPR) repeat protein
VTLEGNAATVWDVVTRERLAVLRGHKGQIADARFTADGARLVTAGHDDTVRVWSILPADDPAAVSLGSTDLVESVEWDPGNGRVLVVCQKWAEVGGAVDGRGNAAYVWDGTTGKRLAALRAEGVSKTRAVHFSSDGRRAVVVCDEFRRIDGTDGAAPVRVYEVPSGKELFALKGLPGGVSSAAFSPDGSRLLTVSDGSALKQEGWDPPRFRYVGQNKPYDVVHVWDAADGTLRYVLLEAHTGEAGVSWSGDGRRICTFDGRGPGVVWDAATGRRLAELRGSPHKPVWSVFSPDGRRLLAPTAKDPVTMWDAATGERLFDVPGDVDWHDCVFSPDGRWVVSRGSPVGKETPAVWDAETGKLRALLRGPQGWVRSVAYSPDGAWIASCGNDDAVRVWYAESGKEFLTLPYGSHHIEFSRDSRWVLGAKLEPTAYKWSIDPLLEAVARKPRGLTDDERELFEIGAAPAPAPRLGERTAPRPSHRRRGVYYAEGGWWAKADAEFTNALELDPDDLYTLYFATLVKLALGDAAGYRKVCEHVLECFGATEDPEEVWAAAWICALAPQAAERETLARLAEKAHHNVPARYGARHWVPFYITGALYYHAGQTDKAIAILKEEVARDESDATAIHRFFLAMACMDANDVPQAKAWLEKAVRTVEQSKETDWNKRLEWELLRREAERKINAGGK